MQLESDNLKPDQRIPEEFAFGIIDRENGDSPVAFGSNRNPHLRWSVVPEGTKSFVVICVDADVPSEADDVNQADREVPADLPRTDFYHWVMVDVPEDIREIPAGAYADGVIAKGKQEPMGPPGSRQGLNNYTDWFDGDADMEGEYYGYDGPCPPWNDSIKHHYAFRVYATDLVECPVDDGFRGETVLETIADHILGQAELVVTYSLNPRLVNN